MKRPSLVGSIAQRGLPRPAGAQAVRSSSTQLSSIRTDLLCLLNVDGVLIGKCHRSIQRSISGMWAVCRPMAMTSNPSMRHASTVVPEPTNGSITSRVRGVRVGGVAE